MRWQAHCVALLLASLVTGAAAAATATLQSAAVVSDRVVRLETTGVDPAACCDAAAVSVALANGSSRRSVPVARIGVDRQVTALRAAPAAATSTVRLHVELAQPLPPRQDVLVQLPALGLTARVRFDPDARTSAIAVNQLGYVPTGVKVARVGDWLGSAGPMPITANSFEVIDRTGTAVLRGPLRQRQLADPWSGDDVYTADFSALQANGRYRLRIGGLGTSTEFEIRDDVYDTAYRTVMRVLYHQRNGTAIEARHAAAPAFARTDGVPQQFDAVLDVAVNRSPLKTTSRPGTYRATRRGWFDAGDYGQYVTNAAPVWFAVGLGFDLAPSSFRDGDLNLPESGNGLADVLDELEWGFDWMLSMQDADGGVFSRVASERWDDGLPGQVRRPRLIAEKTTHATASFAAVAAIHARLLREQRPQRADEALAAARLAWEFLETHPAWPAEGDRYRNREGMHAGEYADTSSLDNRLWAAAELHRATGERRFLDFFERNVGGVKLDPTGEVTYAHQGMGAIWAYLQSNDSRRDSRHVADARKAIVAGAEWRLRQMQANAWGAPVHPARALVGWGSFAHSTRATLTLLQAYQLTQDRRFITAAWSTTDAQLGVNPQGRSYITGLGTDAPRHPLSKLSQYSTTGRALPGLPVPGPHARLPGVWPTTRAVTAAYWPLPADEGSTPGDGYPVLRRYTDSNQLPPMNEPTVAEIARIGVAFGLLREGRSLGAQSPGGQQ